MLDVTTCDMLTNDIVKITKNDQAMFYKIKVLDSRLVLFCNFVYASCDDDVHGCVLFLRNIRLQF